MNRRAHCADCGEDLRWVAERSAWTHKRPATHAPKPVVETESEQRAAWGDR